MEQRPNREAGDESKRSYGNAARRNSTPGSASHLPERNPSPSGVLNYMARSREELQSDDGPSADEGVPGRESGHRGQRPPTQAGVA